MFKGWWNAWVIHFMTWSISCSVIVFILHSKQWLPRLTQYNKGSVQWTTGSEPCLRGCAVTSQRPQLLSHILFCLQSISISLQMALVLNLCPCLAFDISTPLGPQHPLLSHPAPVCFSFGCPRFSSWTLTLNLQIPPWNAHLACHHIHALIAMMHAVITPWHYLKIKKHQPGPC